MKHITNIALSLALVASTGLSGMISKRVDINSLKQDHANRLKKMKAEIFTNIKQDKKLNLKIDKLNNDLVIDNKINPSEMKNYIELVKQAAHRHAEQMIANSQAKAFEKAIINFTNEFCSVVSGLPKSDFNVKTGIIGIDLFDKIDSRFQEQKAYASRDLALQPQKDFLNQNNVRKQKRKVVLNSKLRKQRRQSMLINKKRANQKTLVNRTRKRISLDNTMRKKRRKINSVKIQPQQEVTLEQELEKKKIEVMKQLTLVEQSETLKQESNQSWFSWGWNKVKQYTTRITSGFVNLAQSSLNNWQRLTVKQKVAVLAIAATATTAYFLAQTEGEISCLEQNKADLERILSYCSDNPTEQMCIENIDSVQFHHSLISR